MGIFDKLKDTVKDAVDEQKKALTDTVGDVLGIKKNTGAAPPPSGMSSGVGYNPAYQKPPTSAPASAMPPPPPAPAVSPPPMAAAGCQSCGASVEDGAKFCPGCGTPVQTKLQAQFCANCGNKLEGARFCGSCGTPAAQVGVAAPPPPPAYKPVTVTSRYVGGE